MEAPGHGEARSSLCATLHLLASGVCKKEDSPEAIGMLQLNCLPLAEGTAGYIIPPDFQRDCGGDTARDN